MRNCDTNLYILFMNKKVFIILLPWCPSVERFDKACIHKYKISSLLNKSLSYKHAYF